MTWITLKLSDEVFSKIRAKAVADECTIADAILDYVEMGIRIDHDIAEAEVAEATRAMIREVIDARAAVKEAEADAAAVLATILV